jgi:hypothetical protein
MRLRRWATLLNLLLAAVLMFGVWVLLVFAASRPALRTLIDLTAQQLNSVDPTTEALLEELGERKVEFHLFFPRVSGQAQDPAQRQMMVIRDRLQQATRLLVERYRWLGGDAVEVIHHDLVHDLAATREAAGAFQYKGRLDEVVVAVRQSGMERRHRKLSLVADLAEIRLPELQPGQGPGAQLRVPVLKRYLGEVALSSAIKSLLVQGAPIAYLLKGYEQGGVDYEQTTIGIAYGRFLTRLGELGFRTAPLDLARARAVPRDAALVILLEPARELPERDAEALFEYVRGGGRLFVNYAFSPVGEDRNPTGGRLGELLGYEVGPLPICHLIPDFGRAGGRGLDGDPAVRKLQLALNPQHPITRGLHESGQPIEVAEARELRARPSPPAGIAIEPLLVTGPSGWLQRKGSDGRPDFTAPAVGLREFVTGLAISVAPPAGAAAGAPGSGEVVLVSGLFCNNRGLPLFGDLAFNICNWLAERRVLLDIQSRQYHPAQMQLQPQQAARARTFLVWIVPGLLFLGGCVVFFVRRRI